MLICVLVAGTVGFMILERLTATDSFYFTVVTISTVGYGDINPVTSGAKILSIVLILAGVSSFTGFIVNGTQLLVERRQENLRNERLNMLTGIFFSELGNNLLHFISSLDTEINLLRNDLQVVNDWNDIDFKELVKSLKKHKYNIMVSKSELKALSKLLKEEGDLVLRLLENPSLVERERFTDLLRATIHVKNELQLRNDLSELPQADIDHLLNDIKRAYMLLAEEWIIYMWYLQKNYPYMFSLALRTNPFYLNPSPIVN